jgi:hypothetical protein
LELHTSPVGGHSGFLKTYHRVKKDFFWDGLKTNVQRFVAECVVCQQNKVETIKTLGLLQPLSIPSQRWEEVSMDFITGLPKSEGKSVIMVIVDRLTKYAHFCALSHPFKASTVATAFMETVQKLQKIPLGKMSLLYRSIQSYSSVADNTCLKGRGMLSPNIGSLPLNWGILY